MKTNMNTVMFTMLAIAGTGLLLNLAGNGKLGSLSQTVAQKITAGYGV